MAARPFLSRLRPNAVATFGFFAPTRGNVAKIASRDEPPRSNETTRAQLYPRNIIFGNLDARGAAVNHMCRTNTRTVERRPPRRGRIWIFFST
jgi:hypothetical protein